MPAHSTHAHTALLRNMYPTVCASVPSCSNQLHCGGRPDTLRPFCTFPRCYVQAAVLDCNQMCEWHKLSSIHRPPWQGIKIAQCIDDTNRRLCCQQLVCCFSPDIVSSSNRAFLHTVKSKSCSHDALRVGARSGGVVDAPGTCGGQYRTGCPCDVVTLYVCCINALK